MNPAIRQAGRFVLGAVLTVAAIAPESANAGGNDSLPKVVSGELRSLRGQYVTKSQASEIRLPGGARIFVHGTTDASILTEPQSLMLLPGKKSTTYTVILRRGLVDIDVPGETPNRLAVAVGTSGDFRLITFNGRSSIKVDGRNVVAVCHHGLTTVAHKAKLAKLPPAVKRSYPAHGNVLDVPMLEATRWIGGRRVWISTANAAVPVSGYVWEKVTGATGYLAVLRDLTSRRVVSRTRSSQPVIESFSQPLGPGRYELDIFAIDNDGMVSNHRNKIPITVVGVELPGGAVALPKDTIVVTPEQQVRLTSYAEGLTLTTAAHKSGVAATEPFGLEGLDRATILIHPPSGGDSATLTLVRREPAVSVWVGPKFATWPDDPVQLQVSFMDAHGQATPRDIESTVRVLVGVQPVEVQWDKQGSLWQAHLPPVKGHGPWVVRLEVVDQYGNIIGRDFAEITKARGAPRFSDAALSVVAQRHHE